MEFPTLSRLGRLRKELGPTLKQLGLTAKVGVDEESGLPQISFINKERPEYSPVRIIYGDRRGTDWEGSYLCWEDWTLEDVGNTGWKFFHDEHGEGYEILGSDNAVAIEEIRSAIEEFGVIYREGHPRRCHDERFPSVCRKLELTFSQYDNVFIACQREEGIESLKLIDPFGRDWKLSLPGKDVIVSVNGTDVAKFPATKPFEIAAFIENEINELVKGRGRFL